MSSSGTPTANVTTATALNATFFTGRGPPTYLTNPHGWQSCGLLYYLIPPRHLDIQLRLSQAIPSLGYHLRDLDFQSRLPQALPRLGYN